ncbi:MAG: histidine--tRNA ligase, partial [Halobacteriaceae archaeon]
QAAIRAVDKRAKIERDEYIDLLLDAGLSDDGAEQFDEALVAAGDDLNALLDVTDSETMVSAVRNLRDVLGAADD